MRLKLLGTITALLVLLAGGLFLKEKQELDALPPKIESTSGIINEVELNPSADRVNRFSLDFAFNAYSFSWPKETSFSYSWDGKEFQEPELQEDNHTNVERNHSEIYFQDEKQTNIYVKSNSTNSITLTLFDTTNYKPANNFPIGIGGDAIPGQVNLDSGANYSELNIVTRKNWGADEKLMAWDADYWPVNKIVVHHTVWTNSGNYDAVVRAIYLYHAVTLGWGDIGYNYLIAPDGKIYEGRTGGASVIGGHAYAQNGGSIGISFIGNFEISKPTNKAIDSFQKLLAERALLHGLELKWHGNVFGHKDMPKAVTACPGSNLYIRLKGIVAGAEELRIASLEESSIAKARQTTQEELEEYDDIRLKLLVPDTSLSKDELKQLLPAYSDIDEVTEIGDNSITFVVKSYSSYYGELTEHTRKHLKLLHTIFSLDPNFASVNTLTNPVTLSYFPLSEGTIVKGGRLYVEFSRPMFKETGNIRIKQYSDDTQLEAIDASSSKVKKPSARVFAINHSAPLQLGTKYYLTICPTCFKDSKGKFFTGFSDKETWNFTAKRPTREQEDFDGDEIADLVIRDSDKNMLIDFSENHFVGWDVRLLSYGGPTLIPYPSDYDGDKKIDISVRSKDGIWRIDYAENGFGSWDFSNAGYAGEAAIVLPADYDGDGKTDLSVRTKTGAWKIDYAENGFDGWDTSAPDHGGIYTKPLPADYDGDGKIDMAVRTNGGIWRIDYAKGGFKGWDFSRSGYGGSAATPLPADYDGDGKTDLSFRKSKGTWIIDYSKNGFGGRDVVRKKYGRRLARALPADYDGDGKADLSIRKHSGRWNIDYAKDGFKGWNYSKRIYGSSLAKPAMVDFDGDKKIDLAVRTNSGKWLIDFSKNKYGSIDRRVCDLATGTAKLVPADYDGDGKADVSTSTYQGAWFLDKSENGLTGFEEFYGGYGGQLAFADYDGDGKTDVATKIGAGILSIDLQSNGFGAWDFSEKGYGTRSIPVPADYDGDKKADIAFKYPDGGWKIDFAQNGFGSWDKELSGYGADAIPAPGDYDGDRIDDIASKSDAGVWGIDFAENGFTGWDQTFSGYGNNSQTIKVMDFDGDKKSDISAKAKGGTWRIDYSSNGFGAWDEQLSGYGGRSVITIPGDYDGDTLTDLSIYTNDKWLVDYAKTGLGEWDAWYWLEE